jgi:hypothetical protein
MALIQLRNVLHFNPHKECQRTGSQDVSSALFNGKYFSTMPPDSRADLEFDRKFCRHQIIKTERKILTEVRKNKI